MRATFISGLGDGNELFRQGAFHIDEFEKDAPRRSAERYSAVAVAGPFDGELLYAIAVSVGSHDDLDVEGEAVGDALAVEFFRDVAAIDLEAALGIGQVGGDLQPGVYEPSKRPGTDLSQPALLPVDFAALHLSRTVRDVANAVFQHLQAGQYVVIGHAAAAVGEHHVVADRVGHARADGSAFAAVGLQAKHAAGDADGRGDFPGLGGSAVLAAVVNDDDLAGHVVVL